MGAIAHVKTMMEAPQLAALAPGLGGSAQCCASLHATLMAQCEAYLADLRYSVACIVWVRQLDLWSNAAQRYWSGHVALLWKIRPMSTVCTRLMRLLDSKRRCFICVNNITERVRERAAALQRAAARNPGVNGLKSERSEFFEYFVLGPVIGVRNSGLRNAPGQYGLGIGRPMARAVPSSAGEMDSALTTPPKSQTIGSFFERTQGTFESTVQASFLRSRRGQDMERIRRARVAFGAARGNASRGSNALGAAATSPTSATPTSPLSRRRQQQRRGFGASGAGAGSSSSSSAQKRGELHGRGRSESDGPGSADLSQFETLADIARGAFGRVRLVRKRITRDVFALKEIDKEQCMRKNQAAQALVEIDALRRAGAASPFVVQIYYSFQTRKSLFLVLEYCPGGDCAALLANCGRLEEHVARVYVAETLLALRHIHGLGFVHRDLKPEQLLIDATGHIKLTDFGLSQEAISGEVDQLRADSPGLTLTLRRDFDGAGLDLDDDVDALYEDRCVMLGRLFFAHPMSRAFGLFSAPPARTRLRCLTTPRSVRPSFLPSFGPPYSSLLHCPPAPLVPSSAAHSDDAGRGEEGLVDADPLSSNIAPSVVKLRAGSRETAVDDGGAARGVRGGRRTR